MLGRVRTAVREGRTAHLAGLLSVRYSRRVSATKTPISGSMSPRPPQASACSPMRTYCRAIRACSRPWVISSATGIIAWWNGAISVTRTPTYCVAKGCRISLPAGITQIGAHNWQEEYDLWLVSSQQPDGSSARGQVPWQRHLYGTCALHNDAGPIRRRPHRRDHRPRPVCARPLSWAGISQPRDGRP